MCACVRVTNDFGYGDRRRLTTNRFTAVFKGALSSRADDKSYSSDPLVSPSVASLTILDSISRDGPSLSLLLSCPLPNAFDDARTPTNAGDFFLRPPLPCAVNTYS